MNTNERIEATINLMHVLATHGLDTFPIYQQLKDNLFDDVELMTKAIAKARRVEIETRRKTKAAERATVPETQE